MPLPIPATPLLARMFGVWTLLAAVVRFAFAANPYNRRSVSPEAMVWYQASLMPRHLAASLGMGHTYSECSFYVFCSLFLATLLSFLLAFGHFASEVFLYGTAELSFGSIAPLLVSGEILKHSKTPFVLLQLSIGSWICTLYVVPGIQVAK